MINRRILLNSLLLALSIILGYNVVIIDSPFSSVNYFKDENRPRLLELAAHIGSGNPEIYFKLGNMKDILMAAEENEVKLLYLETVKRNPIHVDSLLKLADMSISEGDMQVATKIVHIAEKYSSMSAERLWELSFIAYKLQDMSLFYRCLRTVATIDDNRKDYVYQLAHKLVSDEKNILTNIISKEAFNHYLSYSMWALDYNSVTLAYNYAIDNDINIQKDVRLKYLEYLIKNGKGENAVLLWESLYGQKDQLVINGGFEEELIGHGFGWRFDERYDGEYETKTLFETVNPLKDKRSLKIAFLNKNPDYSNITQYVAVQPKKSYLLSSIITTKDLTSDKGIGWEISCVAGGNLYEETEYLVGTNIEKFVFVDFITPGDCSMIRINLRRRKSDKFNKYISGEVFIDDVSIRKSY